MSEFNLSHEETSILSKTGFEKDVVKEFIRRLKENLDKEINYCEGMLKKENHDLYVITKFIFEGQKLIIDKLAGENLI